MEEAHLTQQEIDSGSDNENGSGDGLYARISKHPVLAGGAILVGAGLAYAAFRTIQSAADTWRAAFILRHR